MSPMGDKQDGNIPERPSKTNRYYYSDLQSQRPARRHFMSDQ